MARDDRSLSGDHVNWWHLLAHAIAFCTAAAIGAILLYPSYPESNLELPLPARHSARFLPALSLPVGSVQWSR
jgi:hypothetical protein